MLGFVKVSGADIENLSIERLAQRLCAAKPGEENNFCGRKNRNRGVTGGCSDISEQRKYRVTLNETLRIICRQLWFIFVISSHDFDLSTKYPTLLIDAVEID